MADKLQKTRIGGAEKWLVDSAREVGLDLEGFEHEITDDLMDGQTYQGQK